MPETRSMTRQALSGAAKVGDLQKVRQLIKRGASVNSLNRQERTPLHRAAMFGRYNVVDFLSSLPQCNLNLRDCDGCTPLLLAVKKGKKRVVHLLMQRGAQINCADNEGWTLLHHAARKGVMATVRHLLDMGVEVDPNDGYGCSPLTEAAMCGHEDIVAHLIRAGADVNHAGGPSKRSALQWAAYYGKTKVIQVLLQEEGLDINHQDKDGMTALHYAWWLEDLKPLLVAGADTTLKSNRGETALCQGIRRGISLDRIRLLVEHGAFLEDCDYVHISQDPVLKENILKDVGICTQSIVNKFHRQSLPALKSMSYFARKLPNVDNFKLKARQIDEVENFVKGEIERNTFCNVVRAHPMSLSALCVLSLITCQSDMK